MNTLNEIRAQGWVVAIHNDYRQNGEGHTFWLFTREDGPAYGRYVKGEGRSDEEALQECARLIRGEGAKAEPALMSPEKALNLACEFGVGIRCGDDGSLSCHETGDCIFRCRRCGTLVNGACPRCEAEPPARHEDPAAMLEDCRDAVALPKDKPISFIPERVKQEVESHASWRARSTDYEERWAKLCDLYNVSYGAEPELLIGLVSEVRGLMREMLNSIQCVEIRPANSPQSTRFSAARDRIDAYLSGLPPLPAASDSVNTAEPFYAQPTTPQATVTPSPLGLGTGPAIVGDLGPPATVPPNGHRLLIDGKPHFAPKELMSGLDLRSLRVPPIGPSHDLFLVRRNERAGILPSLVPDAALVNVLGDKEFYSAPKQSNASAEPSIDRSHVEPVSDRSGPPGTAHSFRPPPDGALLGKDWSGVDKCSFEFIEWDTAGRRHTQFCYQSKSAHAIPSPTAAHPAVCCSTQHEAPEKACVGYEMGSNGRCVYCDHEKKCHVRLVAEHDRLRAQHPTTPTEQAEAPSNDDLRALAGAYVSASDAVRIASSSDIRDWERLGLSSDTARAAFIDGLLPKGVWISADEILARLLLSGEVQSAQIHAAASRRPIPPQAQKDEQVPRPCTGPLCLHNPPCPLDEQAIRADERERWAHWADGMVETWNPRGHPDSKRFETKREAYDHVARRLRENVLLDPEATRLRTLHSDTASDAFEEAMGERPSAEPEPLTLADVDRLWPGGVIYEGYTSREWKAGGRAVRRHVTRNVNGKWRRWSDDARDLPTGIPTPTTKAALMALRLWMDGTDKPAAPPDDKPLTKADLRRVFEEAAYIAKGSDNPLAADHLLRALGEKGKTQ